MLIKWVGGKQQLVPQLLPLLPPQFSRYCEPFFGGGALFFALCERQGAPIPALLSDRNWKLVFLYQCVRDNPNEVIRLLRRLTQDHDLPNSYYAARARFNFLVSRATPQVSRGLLPDSAELAALFLFLNKTGFNGLYRENSKGEYNVPAGRFARSPLILNSRKIQHASTLLSSATLISEDFSNPLASLKAGEFAYLDPPYYPTSTTSSFTSYTQGQFLAGEHNRLAMWCDRLTSRGVYWMLSNSNTPFVRQLFKDRVGVDGKPVRIMQALARRSVNAVASKRGPVMELIIRNYGEAYV